MDMFVKRKADQQRIIPRAVERNVAQKKASRNILTQFMCNRTVTLPVSLPGPGTLKLKARLQKTFSLCDFTDIRCVKGGETR